MGLAAEKLAKKRGKKVGNAKEVLSAPKMPQFSQHVVLSPPVRCFFVGFLGGLRDPDLSGKYE